ncbi:Serine/threonine protein kinase [Mycena indigotica]|uniref:Serine/threonine protein kinase n=1 Tax=Mycena indigotica TaxID=2126181 RepID=A0A8H6SWC8_9AGAR|nr:Serine/threonine protein kinase [Mycena indigotica]KAF7306651.1 Serine/threonine protein kinase [Mycena indigotica]
MMLAHDRLASRGDSSSIFFRTLCAGFKPPLQQTLPIEPPSICEELPVEWSRPEPATSSAPRRMKSLPKNIPREVLTKQIYHPTKKWEWTSGLAFKDTEPRVPLSSGTMCSAFIRTGLIGDRPLQYVSKLWLTNAKWQGFFSELALYKVQLKSLQGRIVPSIINVYATVGAIDVAMEPPHHSFWVEASADMPNVLKKRCIRAYEQLHTAGVLHGDVELRHMLIGGDARVTIIDFQESRALIPNPAVKLGAATPAQMQLEMRKVKYRLDYQGARDLEDQKVMRSKRLARRNATGSREPPSQDDILNPPVSIRDWEGEWHAPRPDPQRFVMPGQSTEDLEKAVERFLDILEKLEEEGDPEDKESLPPIRKKSPEFKLPALPIKTSKQTPPAPPRPPKRKAEHNPDNQHKRAKSSYNSQPRNPPPPGPPPPIRARDFASHPSWKPKPALHPSPPTKRKRDPDLDLGLEEEEDQRPSKRVSTEIDPSLCPHSTSTLSVARIPPKAASWKDDSSRISVPSIFKWIENMWRVVS